MQVLEFPLHFDRAQFSLHPGVVLQGLFQLCGIRVICRKLRLSVGIVLNTGRGSRDAVSREKGREFLIDMLSQGIDIVLEKSPGTLGPLPNECPLCSTCGHDEPIFNGIPRSLKTKKP